jgi:hypothetical protein
LPGPGRPRIVPQRGHGVRTAARILGGMETMLIALTATGTTLLTAPLAVVAAGIRRQERAGSLSARPPGPAAALTRKLLALHTESPTDSALSNAAQRRSPAVPARRRPAVSAAIVSEARS